MSYAARIAQKPQHDRAFVVQIAGATDYWFSTIPIAAKTEAVPILKPLTLPSREMSLKGGGSKVGTLRMDLSDISGVSLKATSVLYRHDCVGRPIYIYSGYAADTTWNTTNFPQCWAGRITDCEYVDGEWQITAEDVLGLVKGRTLVLPEFTANVATTMDFNDTSLVLESCLGTLANASTPSDELGGDGSMEDAGDVAKWAVQALDGGGAISLSQSDTYAHGGTYSAKCTIGSANYGKLYAFTYYNSGAYLPLPAGHRPGESYTIQGWARCAVAGASGGKYRLIVYSVDAGGNILDWSGLPGGTTFTTAFVSMESTICVAHPSATALKIQIEFQTNSADPEIQTGDLVPYFDDFVIYKVPVFFATGREIVGVLAWSNATLTATVCRGCFGTLPGDITDGDKVRRIWPFVGFSGTLIERFLTTSSVAGTNGDLDYGDGYGADIDDGQVDTAALDALATSHPYHAHMILLDKGRDDLLEFLDDEILKPLGATLGVSKRGLATVWVLPDSVSSGTYTLSDSLLAEKPKVGSSRGDVVNVVHAQTDFDFLDAIDTSRFSNPATETSEQKKTRDPKYLGYYRLDEKDHRVDFAYRDGNYTSQTRFGVHEHTLKSASVRGLPSASLGLPVLRQNFGAAPSRGAETTTYVYQRGEEMVRHLSTRLLTYYCSTVYSITYPTFAWAEEVEVGETVSITTELLPNLHPSTGGGMGFSAVKGFVRGKSYAAWGCTLVVVVTDWAATIAEDHDYSGDTMPTDPYYTEVANNNLTLASKYSTDWSVANCSTLEYIPKTLARCFVLTHRYGNTDATLPSADGYARTETTRYVSYALQYGPITRNSSISSFAVTYGLAPASTWSQATFVYWLRKDGTYSTGYTWDPAP